MQPLLNYTRSRRIAARATLLRAAIGFVGIGCCAGCPEVDSPAAGPLVLVASGDTAGWIVPCGCATNQSGGLLRRGEYLDELNNKSAVIYVDVGGAPSGAAEYDIAKFEAILRGERAMGLALHNIGAAEAALGAAELRRVENMIGAPLFVSANVRDQEGRRIGLASQIIESAGRRVFITGVLSPDFAPTGMRVLPPRAEILAELSAAGEHDVAIVLAYAPEPELRQLARQLPEVDAVIGGPTGQAIAPERIGSTLLAAATNKGKFLIELQLPAAGGEAISGKAVEISDSFVDHPAQRANLAHFYELLAERDFTPAQTSFTSHASGNISETFRIAGTQSCRACHTGDCQVWDASGHAHAWETLQRDGSHVDSYCQQCHVTGYAAAGGFASARRTPQHAGVGCESCHGPSQSHAADPQSHTAYYQNAAATCTGCHDRENSPQFDYAEYWPQIEHGTRSSE